MKKLNAAYNNKNENFSDVAENVTHEMFIKSDQILSFLTEF